MRALHASSVPRPPLLARARPTQLMSQRCVDLFRRPRRPRSYLFRTSADPHLFPSPTPSFSRLPCLSLPPTDGVALEVPAPQPPPTQPSAAAVPPLSGEGCLVRPPFVPCKPLGCVLHDACAAYRLCRDVAGFDVLT